MNNLKLYEFNFSLHVELELEVSTLDKFNYHQCQFLTLNSQIGCFYYQGGMEVGRRESIIYSVRVFTVRNSKILILLMAITYHDNQFDLTPVTRSPVLYFVPTLSTVGRGEEPEILKEQQYCEEK